MNSAAIIRFGFVTLLLAVGLSLACKASTTQVKSVEVEPAPQAATVCQLGHSC